MSVEKFKETNQNENTAMKEQAEGGLKLKLRLRKAL